MPNRPTPDARPLEGLRVVVTRPAHGARALSGPLQAAGAAPVELPLIRIVPPDDPAPLDRAAREAEAYDWLLLTSGNGVRAFVAARERAGLPPLPSEGPALGAVGPGTARALADLGRAPDLVPDEFVGEAVVDAVVAAGGGSAAGQRVLLPVAEIARDVLPEGLRRAGATVDVVTAYRTVGPTPETARALREAVAGPTVDAITFTASSTVRHCAEVLGPGDAPARLAPLVVASIGPVTTETAESLGIRVDATAEDYTNGGLVAALAAHVAGRGGRR